MMRIVGKLFAERKNFAFSGSQDDPDPAVLFGAGFFVARANDLSVGGGSGTPIGSATIQERRDHYSPLDTDTVREPWIWRRTWILGLSGRAPRSSTAVGPDFPTATIFTAHWPASTGLYGSVMDGPHIDSKVKRRIGQDDRLWFAISATPYPLGQNTSGNLNVEGYLDYRLFGALRKARSRSAF